MKISCRSIIIAVKIKCMVYNERWGKIENWKLKRHLIWEFVFAYMYSPKALPKWPSQKEKKIEKNATV